MFLIMTQALLIQPLLNYMLIFFMIILCLLYYVNLQYYSLLRELQSCLRYLDPKSKSSYLNIKNGQFFISLINKLSIYIDSEFDNAAKNSFPKKVLKGKLEDIGNNISALIIITKRNGNLLELVNSFGSANQAAVKVLLPELTLLDQHGLNDHCRSLESTIYSCFHEHQVRYLLKESFDKYTHEEILNSYALWFCFPSADSISLQVLMKIKKFSKEYISSYFQKQQIKGLNGKIAKSRHDNILKGKLISGLSHDLRSPINNLQAINSCLLDHQLVSEGGSDLLDMANANLRVLNELIEDFLSLAKFRAGNLLAQTEDLKLFDLFEDLHQIYQFDAKFKNLNLQFDYPSIDFFIHADRLHFKRIIGNLLSNAIKYTPKGKVRLSCTFQEQVCQISVFDTGVGLSPEQISRICRPFVRFSDHEIEGVGLGLAITKLLIELNSGKLEIVSETGKGSEFRVILPTNQLH